MPEDKPLDNKHRPIRSFSRRVGRMTEGQRLALENFRPLYGIEHTSEHLDFEKIFQNSAPVTIEIGFGMGEALIEMAQLKPDENFIGVDVHTPGVGHVFNETHKHEIKNIRVIEFDAVEVLKHQIPDHSVNNFCVFFSDPWHKTKHQKRRLLNESFAKVLAKKLVPDGKLYLATDWEHYANQMLNVFNANKSFKNLSPTNEYCERIEFRTLTKFEKRGQRLGHGVWDLIFQKKT